MLHSWLTPKSEVRPAPGKGVGVFATESIAAGETVSAFGGHVMTRPDFERLPVDRQVHSLQIAEHLFMTCPADAEPADSFNHSCEPNCGLAGNVVLVAIRDIDPDEELSFDYSMCDADDYDEFECRCRSDGCRRKVTGNDWMNRDLQERYAGYFSTYLEQRIRAMRAEPRTDHPL